MANTNAVIDISHHNGDVDLQQAKTAGVVGIIQKATQGTSYIDPTFARNRSRAAGAGLLFGAYHFGVGADGVEQAGFFVRTVQPGPGDLLVLDFEANPQGPSMTLDEARAFVLHVQSVTGKFPGLYSGHYLKELLGASVDPVLVNCWLWISQYGPAAIIPPAWKSWTMWQYTDGGAGNPPHQVPGIGRCDRDIFNGTPEQLRAFWQAGGVLPAIAAVS